MQALQGFLDGKLNNRIITTVIENLDVKKLLEQMYKDNDVD